MNYASSTTASSCAPEQVLALLIFFFAVGAAAFFAGRFRPGAWYEALAKPAWNPPAHWFAPIWTLLYIAIAVAGWLVWCAARGWHPALALWLAQLLLNAAWPPLMFGLRRPDLASLDIVLLLALAIAFIAAAWALDRLAALLFVPYALWLAFAAALTVALWRRNRYRPMPPRNP